MNKVLQAGRRLIRSETDRGDTCADRRQVFTRPLPAAAAGGGGGD